MAIGHDGDDMPRPRHSAPLRLGAIDPEQRKRIFIDFLLPIALISCFTAMAISAVWLPEPSEWVAGLATTLVVSLLLWRRCGTLHAEHVDGALAVRNLFWSYRIPDTSVRKVVTRHCWFGGIYGFCFGVRTNRGLHRLRSIPLHAADGEGRQRRDLEELLEVEGMASGRRGVR